METEQSENKDYAFWCLFYSKNYTLGNVLQVKLNYCKLE